MGSMSKAEYLYDSLRAEGFADEKIRELVMLDSWRLDETVSDETAKEIYAMAGGREKLKLSKPEFMLIVDSTNGLAFHEGLSIKDQIELEVADSIEGDGLAEKWGVDKNAIMEKLSNATEEEYRKLWEDIRTFWARNDRENHA